MTRNTLLAWAFVPVTLIVGVAGWFLPAANSVVKLPFWLGTLILFVVSGAAGGVVAFLQKFGETGDADARQEWTRDNFLRGIVVSATGGLGGAIAALFVMIIDGKISRGSVTNPMPPVLDDINVLSYIATAFVSGYIGFRFLKSVADKFELLNAAKSEAKKEAKEEVQRAVESVEERTKRLEATVGRNQEIDAALEQFGAAIQAGNEFDISSTRSRVEELHEKYPDDRRLAIRLAEYYKRRGAENFNLGRSIQIMDRCIASFEKLANKNSFALKDLSDLHFNRAGYRNLMARVEIQPERATHLRVQAIQDLAISFKLSPENAQEAAVDSDYSELKNEPGFLDLMTRYGVTVVQADSTDATGDSDEFSVETGRVTEDTIAQPQG
ncbi:hypothetical protein P12x_002532 [Tundrisphaera lichenicola]|uniref:hypothetical protein n=1 Tax=Tundrisphaera lichenicola TaxID=2029860 RepID=UPI003EBC0BA8